MNLLYEPPADATIVDDVPEIDEGTHFSGSQQSIPEIYNDAVIEYDLPSVVQRGIAAPLKLHIMHVKRVCILIRA